MIVVDVTSFRESMMKVQQPNVFNLEPPGRLLWPDLDVYLEKPLGNVLNQAARCCIFRFENIVGVGPYAIIYGLFPAATLDLLVPHPLSLMHTWCMFFSRMAEYSGSRGST